MDFNKENDHTWTIGSQYYITDASKHVSEILKTPLGNKNIPTVNKFHTEFVTTPICNLEETNN